MVRVSILILGSYIYLKSLRRALYSAIDRWASFNNSYMFKLDIWEEIVKHSMAGVPFEKLLSKIPTTIFFVDASGLGIDSYNFNSGLIWNYTFSLDILKFTSINHMKFFTFIVQLLLIEMSDTLDRQYILIWIDN